MSTSLQKRYSRLASIRPLLNSATLPVRWLLSSRSTLPAPAHLRTPRQAVQEGHTIVVTAREYNQSRSESPRSIFLTNREYFLHPYGLQGLRVGSIISPRRSYYNSLKIMAKFSITLHHYSKHAEAFGRCSASI